ncbi:MAG: class I SAM-dependent methyltransferase [Deltaproteobacteria bacterium]|nr:class I SAM-dependent methyltransferase [Deltaproteobacteria bacterium]
MTQPEHRVAAHLGLAASDYDAQIRRYIPEYEAAIATVVELVAALPSPRVVDLGAGTGALGGAILDAVPAARVRMVDIDPAMLEVAHTRVARHGDRVELVRAAFADPLPADTGAVVASLSLHHIADPAEKRATYARIRAALRPGGLVAIADCVVHASGPERDRGFAVWSASMARHGIAAGEAQRLFAAWAAEDFYLPLSTELQLLADAGFARPECFWKYGPIAVYGAYA